MQVRDVRAIRLGVLICVVLLAGCGSLLGSREEPTVTPSAADAALHLTSAAFEDGGTLPSVYTCDGDDVSPPLSWEGAPDATATYALIMDDPDAPVGTWVHWVVYNIPAETTSLAEAVPSEPTLSDGTQQGQNSWSRAGYGGPCPPGGTHRYVFKLYALDTALDLSPSETNKQDLLDAMEGHILARTTLTGRYGR